MRPLRARIAVLRSLKRGAALVLLLSLVLCTPPALYALSIRGYDTETILVEHEAVIEGKVTRIESPRGAGRSAKPAKSIAWVTVNTVHKGELAPGDTVGVLYWSHLGKVKPRWTMPDTYFAGETLVLALK
ncbi:MAG: hypothetical protein ACYSU0_04860, partial [Planctomycetota bacterium]